MILVRPNTLLQVLAEGGYKTAAFQKYIDQCEERGVKNLQFGFRRGEPNLREWHRHPKPIAPAPQVTPIAAPPTAEPQTVVTPAQRKAELLIEAECFSSALSGGQ